MRMEESRIRRIIEEETRQMLNEGRYMSGKVQDLRYFHLKFSEMRPDEIRNMLNDFAGKIYENPEDAEAKEVVIAVLGALGIDENLISDLGGPSALAR